MFCIIFKGISIICSSQIKKLCLSIQKPKAGGNASAELAAVSAAHGGASVIGLERVPREKTSRYGIVEMDGGRIVDMVE